MYESYLREMILAGKKASEEIFRIYKGGFTVKIKEDDSPVTDADLTSDRILRNHLSCFSDAAWLSEEEEDDRSRLDRDLLFIVDPLDGTADFVQKDDSFGINIALVYRGKPVASAVFVPAAKTFAYALKGKGSYFVDETGHEEELHVSDRTKDLIFLTSKMYQLDSEKQVIERHRDLIKEVIASGACTKGILLASGRADCSVRYTKNTKEWDVCAVDLLVTEAGGIFTDSNGVPFTYNRRDVYNREGYSMFNRKENMILLK